MNPKLTDLRGAFRLVSLGPVRKRLVLGMISVKKHILAALLAATTASAHAAVTYNFTGAEFDGGAVVSGSITIDTDALTGGNGATDPALYYYYATDDGSSTSALPFLSVSFTSAGTNPSLLAGGDYTYQYLQADPSDGSFTLELDWVVNNPDQTFTASSFTLYGSGAILTGTTGGVTLPDFAHSGDFYFTAQSGTGANIDYDTASSGTLNFASAAPAPEASTWAMMALGFGAVGTAARRRTRVAFAA